jgi:Flp pilus assembly protein TadG
MNLFEFFARRRRRTRSRGQSLVEFALILPLLLVFLATILDLGRIYYANISLLNAAREGAFQASKTPGSYQSGQPCNTNTNLIVCRVQLESKGSMVEVDTADIDVTCSKTGCPLEASSTVTVHVDGQFQLITPILGFIFGSQTIDLATAATQQIEYFPVGGVSTLPPTPVAAFTASDLTGEAPFAVSFDGTSSSGSPTD